MNSQIGHLTHNNTVEQMPSNKDEALTLLQHTKQQANANNLPYAGGITPTLAWRLQELGVAQIIDVRSKEELVFVGQVPQSVHVPWASGTALTRNPRFTRELESKVKKDSVILLLCRSGKRSALAAEAATKAGFLHVFNVLEGFEGDLNDQEQRSTFNGWRFQGLPWTQS